MNDYPLLFSPLTINQMEMRNRIVLPAMHLNYTPQGKSTDQLVQFYAERAQGGAGLIIVGGCVIGPEAGGPNFISLRRDSDIEDLAGLVQAVHARGAAIGAQLYHAGAYAHQILIGTQAISSSTHQSRFTREEARGLELEEIAGVQDQFAFAARRAREAGFDMVEILGSAGYLICQFLSPKINQRTDQYGGSFENRARFGLEVIAKVRAAVGPDFCVGIRLAGNDFVPGSHANAESARFAAACQEAGVDLFNITGGWHETKTPQITADVPTAGFAYLARGVKRAVSAPVCASNLIHTPEAAEDVLARGDADLVCMARPLIADPELPNKAASGRRELIAPCVSCNQGCFDAVFKMAPIGCLVNPRAGKEAQIPARPQPAAQPRKIVVIGGGPAGCQAAITAAQRGHQVILLEAADHLGGQPAWYYEPTEKPDFAAIAAYHAAALAEAGVEVRLGVRADAEYAAALEPGAVILATGGRPSRPAIPGLDSEMVLDAWDVLRGKRRARGRVAVIGGGAAGLETALYLARLGALTPEQTHFLAFYRAETPEVIDQLIAQGSHQVTVLEALPKLGAGIGRSTRWVVFGKLKRYGVKSLTSVKVLAVEDQALRLEHDGQEQVMPVDTVVIAAGMEPVDELAPELEAKGLAVTKAGDAAGAGSVLASIAQGFQAGLEV